MSRLFHNWIFSKNKKGSVSAKTLVKEVLTELDIPFTDACCPTDSDPENLTNRELTANGGGGSGSAWALEGNADTTPPDIADVGDPIGDGLNYIGTSDDEDVVFARNDVEKMRLETSALHLSTGFQLEDSSQGAGKYLQSDGDGLATWSSFLKPNVQVFTASGTYTPTPGMIFCKVQVQGAGGGGGGTKTTAGGQHSIGLPGAGGGYAEAYISANGIGASKAITVGAAGTAGAVSADGGTGGTSSLTTLVVATGGAGGTSLAVNADGTAVAGGTGSVTASADVEEVITKTGSIGGMCTSVGRFAGKGGDSYFGSGGLGKSSVAAATASTGYGAGGGGSYSGASTAEAVGNIGRAGIVIITEYFN